MQLAHLLPHLDAEIERLQKARDLLALSSSSIRILDAFDTVRAARQKSLQAQLAFDKAAKKRADKPAAVKSVNPIVSAPDADMPKISMLAVRIKTANESRASRRRRLILPDTALRGAVPSGPVVVSAEEVRKSQASKTAQTTRAAEVRQAGAELVSSFNWRSQTTDGRGVDLLLQRLMSIGENTDQAMSPQLPSLGQSEGFQAAAHATAGSKLD
jgi:hypothetical protein